MQAMEKDPHRRAQEHRLFRRLQARARLLELARTPPPSAADNELARLKVYLDEWVKWEEGGDASDLAMPQSASFAPDITSATTATEYTERSNRWAMEVIQHAVNEDLLERLEGSAMRQALRVRWLNEKVGAKVFRHGRLEPLLLAEVDDLADRAERELVVIVKKRGLPLA